MGIPGLWDLLGEGQVCSIADYAARHFEQHQRPLRIAVDEACWRFTNLTPEQVQKIRDGEPAANPVEKVILWRLLKLMKLNIQLIFVNDGPKRPWKRGRRGGNKLDYKLIELTRQLFDHLKIPHHRAPAEAEAECARMQTEGIVDAVWSDDGDAFMFGCTTLIKAHKVDSKRVNDHIRVYRAEDILKTHDLDAESLVLFATLAGGDYDTEGLRGCGPKSAALLAKRETKLARALCHASQSDLPAWRGMLQEALRRHHKSVEVPCFFPNWKAVCHYRNPIISTTKQLHDLRGLRQGWDRPMDQMKLRVILRERFNFTTREYMKHLTPIFLSRALTRAKPAQRAENLKFGIQLKRTVKRKTSEGGNAPAKSERKITFSPLPFVEINLGEQPPDEDWSKSAAKDGTPYDPLQNIECEMLECFLRHGLPDDALDADVSPRKSSKRKANDSEVVGQSRVTKKPAHDSPTKVAAPPSLNGCSLDSRPVEQASSTQSLPKKRGRPKNENPASLSIYPAKRKESQKQVAATHSSAPAPAVFRLPRSVVPATVLDLCASGSDSESEQALPASCGWIPRTTVSNRAGHCTVSIPASSPDAETIVPEVTIPVSVRGNASTPPFIPLKRRVAVALGEKIPVETLRDLRASSKLLSRSWGESLASRVAGQMHQSQSARGAIDEVIDLT